MHVPKVTSTAALVVNLFSQRGFNMDDVVYMIDV